MQCEGNAEHGHQEVREGQVGDEEVGHTPETLLRQHDEAEQGVAYSTDDDHRDEGHHQEDLDGGRHGGKQVQTIRGDIGTKV